MGARSGHNQAPGPSFEEVWKRLQKQIGLKRQKELAVLLGIKSPSVTDAKKRGLFPLSWAYQIALQHKISLDLILLGTSECIVHSTHESQSVKAHYIETTAELVDKALKGTGKSVSPEQRAALILMLRDELRKKVINVVTALTS